MLPALPAPPSADLHTKGIQMEIRAVNTRLKQIAEDLIDTEPSLADIAGSAVKIAYLSSDMAKTHGRKLVFGQCEKIPDKYKWSVPYDFTITVFEPNAERFTDEQLRILLLHELMHIGVEKDGNEEVYSIVQHDIEDFRSIIDRYGLDWSNVEQI